MKIIKNTIVVLAIGFILSIPLFSAGFTETICSITGSIKDQKSLKPIAATFVIFDSNGKKVFSGKSSVKDGGYYFATGLRPGNNYDIVMKHGRNITKTISVEIPESNVYLELHRDILISTDISETKSNSENKNEIAESK